MPGPRRGALLGAVALLLAGCSTAEDYLASVNPFRREAPAEGPRRAVDIEDASLRPAPDRVAALAVAGPGAVADWTNPGGPPTNVPPHAFFRGGPAPLWRTAAGEADVNLTAAPLIVGGRAIVFDNRRVAAFALTSGQPVWATSVRADEPGRDVAGGGIASDGQRVYVATARRRLAALDVATGAVQWSRQMPEPARAAPTVAGGRLFVGTAGGAVFAFATSNGAEIWRYSAASTGVGTAGGGSPAVAGDTVYVPFAGGELAALDAARGTSRWTVSLSPSGGPVSSSLAELAARPAASGGTIYVGGAGGRLLALRDRDGAIQWERPIATTQAPVVSGEAVFVLSTGGEVFGLERRTGTVRWRSRVPDGEGRAVWSGPVLAGGMLWVASNRGTLVGFDAATGRLGPIRTLGEGASVAPIAAGGRLLVATPRGALIAFD